MAAIYFCLALMTALYTNQVDSALFNKGPLIQVQNPVTTTMAWFTTTTTQYIAPVVNNPQTTQATTTQFVPIVNNVPIAQGPQVSALNCANYACVPNLGQKNIGTPQPPVLDTTGCANKPATAARPCHYFDHSETGSCYGVYCLTVAQGNEYCICGAEQIGQQCLALKPGSCDQATGFLPPKHFVAQNKRFRQLQRPEVGSVYARHFAASDTDCYKLCQWAYGRCNSVNYGTLNGVQVCELLSVVVTPGSVMQPWLIDAPGWTYTTVVGRAAAV